MGERFFFNIFNLFNFYLVVYVCMYVCVMGGYEYVKVYRERLEDNLKEFIIILWVFGFEFSLSDLLEVSMLLLYIEFRYYSFFDFFVILIY